MITIEPYTGDRNPADDYDRGAVYAVAIVHVPNTHVYALSVRRLTPSTRRTYQRLRRRKVGRFTWDTPAEAEAAARRMATDGSYNSRGGFGTSYAGE